MNRRASSVIRTGLFWSRLSIIGIRAWLRLLEDMNEYNGFESSQDKLFVTLQIGDERVIDFRTEKLYDA